MRFWFVPTLISLVALGACGPGPEGKSGGDGYRHEAKPIPLEEWVTDDDGVNYSEGDQTDWKMIVTPYAGRLMVQIACDEKNATIVAALYDKYGRLLIEKRKKRGRTDHLQFEGEVGKGKFFVRIAAKTSSDKSVYSIRASMEGAPGVGDILPPE